MAGQKQQGKNRKYSRCKNSASHKAYNIERRAERNKERTKKNILKEKERQDIRQIIPHGAARMLRREAWMFAIGGMWENENRLSFRKYERGFNT
jgi:hypothetical protein